MLLRGRNTVGYTPYPTEVTDAFVDEAARDRDGHLPDLRRAQRRRSRCARPSTPCGPPARPSPRSRSATPATCPTRPSGSTPSTTTCAWPSRSSTRARTCWRSRTWPGCCARPRPQALVTALRERFDLPVHLHTHDTAGGQLATLIAAIDAGRGRRGRARWPRMAGTTSQPSLSALVAATDHTERATGLSLQARRRPGAVLGGGAQGLRAVRVRAGVADRARLPPRDPRRAAVQPAPAGDRARARATGSS